MNRLGIVCSLLITSFTTTASAEPPLTDLPGYEVPVEDLAPWIALSSASPLAGQTALSLALSVGLADGKRDITGSAALSFPIERVATKRKKRAKAKEEPVVVAVEEAPSQPRRRRTATGRRLPVIRPRDARAAIAAANRARGSDGAHAELDDMGTRARWSTLLPTTTMRVTRLIDESTSLAPTSYDAERTTSKGGASLWLEARATWSLDRLVFADEEVRISQLHQQLVEKSEQRAERVLELLFTWQNQVYAMHDPALETSKCVEAWLKEQQLGAALDLETGGWFARWRAKRHIPEPACVQLFESTFDGSVEAPAP
jgi:hypothetical protein